MDTCERCGADLGVGRFCLNCGHRIGAPLPPHEEFLPWTEPGPAPADAPPPPPPPPPPERSLHWGRWVLVALVLLALVVALVSCLPDGSDDDPPDTASEADTSAGGPDRPRASNVALRASVRVPSTAPPTTDLDGREVSYGPRRMLDGKQGTAWRMEGDGTGAVISFRLESPTRIRRVGLINGYAKRVAGVNWYPNNRRVLKAAWDFDEGPTVVQSFQARRQVQRMRIEPVTTRTVTLTLTEVSPPGAGELGRDYTALSEVVLIGRPVG